MSEQVYSKKLSFGSRRIDYQLSFQERKTLGIRVYPDCSVSVIAPMATTLEKIEEKLKKKAPWILKQQNEFLSYHPLTPPRKYENGETHLYLGRQYRLKIEKSRKNEVKLSRGQLLVSTKGILKPEKLLRDWYRAKAARIFQVILRDQLPKFVKHGINEPFIQILNMPTRWGSCTTNGKIILNPELVKAPTGSIEYVIVHELCHLVHHNHTRAFYDLQEKVMPDWRKWKERLERSL